MHECLLCNRDMKTSKDTFGNGCVKKIYSFLKMNMPKKVKLREVTLYNNVMKINNIRSINTYQKMWLTDRYLTQQYLKGEKWILDIRLHDRYDYTEFKKIHKYYKDTKSVPKSIFSSTLYNFAWFSVKSKVMKEYDIDIEFKINSDFEVIDL